jgi:hypothetical protein
MYDDKQNRFPRKNNNYFSFVKGGLIFISLVLGLDYISKEYYDSVSYIFKIPYNLDFIGGQNNSANYFIGEYFEQLIYLDPHVNQKAVESLSELLNENEFFSYSSKYFNKIDISKVSPAFTFGFIYNPWMNTTT